MMRGVASWFAAMLVAVTLLLAGATGCANAAAGGRGGRVPAGPAMIVVAPATPSADDQESETYGDWASYLNDFVAGKPAALTLTRVTPDEWRTRLRGPALKDGYATAFVRGDGSALLYQGMILEPDRYTEGSAWAMRSGGGRTPGDGFVEIRLARIR